MRTTRTLPIATEIHLKDLYADRRIWDISEVEPGMMVEHIATGRIVKVLYKNHDYLEVKGRSQPFVRKVSCFARLENER